MVEEAPSPFLTPEIRKAMGEQACLLASAVDYQVDLAPRIPSMYTRLHDSAFLIRQIYQDTGKCTEQRKVKLSATFALIYINWRSNSAQLRSLALSIKGFALSATERKFKHEILLNFALICDQSHWAQNM